MSAKFVAGVGLCALVAPAIALAQGNAGDAGSNWAAMAECGAIRNADRRHACMDDVLQQAGVLSGAQVAQEVREEFGKENRPAPVAAPRSQPAQASAAPARTAPLDEIVSTVATVRAIGYHRVRVTAADGSVWDQTQDEDLLEPRQGERFSVERGSMNSFLCQVGRSSRYRCQRID
jgi:hypothetical protein